MEPTWLRAPTATELAEKFAGGVLAVVGPDPVEGPKLNYPMICSGEQPSFDQFSWEFWIGADLRNVRIEMYSGAVVPSEARFFQALLESWGHKGPATPTARTIMIDGVPVSFRGTSVGDGIALREIVADTAVEILLVDGWPLDGSLRLEHRHGPSLEAMGLTWRNFWSPWEDKVPPDAILQRQGLPPGA